MNERFKELADQAITERLSIDEFIEALKKEPYDFYGFRVSELQKFAELIVKECINLIRENSLDDQQRKEWPTDFVEGHDTCAEVLDETLALHFGIEE